ncbi:MAG: phage scaffolding protein [Oscillospiraceae bacterium]
MEQLLKLIQKLGIELTADQAKQLKEVIDKEFVTAEAAAADKTKLEELTKQLADRDNDLKKLREDNKSEELQKQLDALNDKYKNDTDALNAKLTAQETEFAAEKLFSGYRFSSDRVRKSVLEEFKGKGFKLENGTFLGGKEFLDGLKQSEPSVFAADEKPGLFMGSTQSSVPADSNNLESQIYSGMGLTINK